MEWFPQSLLWVRPLRKRAEPAQKRAGADKPGGGGPGAGQRTGAGGVHSGCGRRGVRAPAFEEHTDGLRRPVVADQPPGGPGVQQSGAVCANGGSGLDQACSLEICKRGDQYYGGSHSWKAGLGAGFQKPAPYDEDVEWTQELLWPHLGIDRQIGQA